MAEPKNHKNLLSTLGLMSILFSIPIVLSVILYRSDDFDPVPLPGGDYFYSLPSVAVPEHRDQILRDSERVGEGLLPGPEDLAYDAENGLVYTGCLDGWIRRVWLAGKDELKVEDWVHIGGRPLGLAFAPDRSLVVADAHKGLLRVKPDGNVELLTDEAEGLKFGLTDGVDVASDGLIYFTDASYKYSLEMHMMDILSGRPHGRLISFDPSTNRTVVLVRDLYFANGVALSPDQKSLIFCESVLRRCRRYYIHGEKKGTIDDFIENLPGFPDNIHNDGEGRYWIGLSAGRTLIMDTLFKYPILRKFVVSLEKFVAVPLNLKDSGVLSVSLEGQLLSLYSDPGLVLATSGLKIGKHLYYGSLHKSYISRIDLTRSGASSN
ncbi:protein STRICTOSIDINE SYNTHASE-LIKE 5-like [Ananas comosus]|uniref:Protein STRICTOSIDINE SYNTHASE-LIKE 5-like n=1 Tax=Ananas comosus TaxID=4615 RepID=A0A6P5FCM7_ANACO|nr:protein STRICTOSIDINE SYNTHASE-LIKE 5-like [Ananas comosus]